MNNEIKFNHNKKQIHSALGIEGTYDELSERMALLVLEFVASGAGKASILAEKMHNELSPNVILLLALQSVHETIEQASIQMEGERSELEKFFDMMHNMERRASKTKSFNPNNN
jgi:hypothetical protein